MDIARSSSSGVNDYDDDGQAALHVAADAGLAEAVSPTQSLAVTYNAKAWLIQQYSVVPQHCAKESQQHYWARNCSNQKHGWLVEAVLEAFCNVCHVSN